MTKSLSRVSISNGDHSKNNAIGLKHGKNSLLFRHLLYVVMT